MRLRRFLGTAAFVTAALVVAPGSASAALAPDPYSFTAADRAPFAFRTVLGTSTCAMSGLVGRLGGTPTGAAGAISAATLGPCSGEVVSATLVPPMSVAVDRGAAAVGFTVRMQTILGGDCQYSGTLTGSAASGTGAIDVGNAWFGDVTVFRGTCRTALSLQMSMRTGASITW